MWEERDGKKEEKRGKVAVDGSDDDSGGGVTVRLGLGE